MPKKSTNPIKWKGEFWWLPALRSMLKEDDGSPAKLVTSVNGHTGDVTIEGGGGSSGVTSVNGKTGEVTINEIKQIHATNITYDYEGPDFYVSGSFLTQQGITKDNYYNRIVSIIGKTSTDYGDEIRLCYPTDFTTTRFFFVPLLRPAEGDNRPYERIHFTDVYIYYI